MSSLIASHSEERHSRSYGRTSFLPTVCRPRLVRLSAHTVVAGDLSHGIVFSIVLLPLNCLAAVISVQNRNL